MRQKSVVTTCPDMIGSVRLGTPQPTTTLAKCALIPLHGFELVLTSARENDSHTLTSAPAPPH